MDIGYIRRDAGIVHRGVSMLSLAIWLQNTEFFAYIRNSTYAYPIILTLHIVFIALFGAMILATDMRLLGWGMRSDSISDIVSQLRVPKRVGLLLVATCGILLLGSKAEEYYLNPFFRIKIVLLVLVGIHALVFRRSVYAAAAGLDNLRPLPGRVKLAAALSLFLWLSIVCAGRAIGYVQGSPGGPHYYAGLWRT